MHHSDPMRYSMEQLVRALSLETMTEFSFDAVPLIEEGGVEADGPLYEEEYTEEYKEKWKSVAEFLIDEIRSNFPDGKVFSHGPDAYNCIDNITAFAMGYSQEPFAGKLLSNIENLLEDPKPFISILVRAMNSSAASEWQNVYQYRSA